MITTHVTAEGIPAFFGIEPKRAEEMIDHFEAIEVKHTELLCESIEEGYKDEERTGIEISYNPIIAECISIATTPNEAAYAAFCASQLINELNAEGDRKNREVGLRRLLRNFM